MSTLIQTMADRIVGVVEKSSTNRIVVHLELDAPHSTAINAGVPARFPRVNGYLVIPHETGATVGVITKVEVVRLPYPKRKGMKDFGLVDLPFQSREVSLTPLATLVAKGETEREASFEVHRGVDVFPSVGDPVLLPSAEQLQVIVEGEGSGSPGHLRVGMCPAAQNAPMHVNPDKLFGRHLAVLGNTGAGKSCSVAGLVRWSLNAADEARDSTNANARFIILDPNGEYANAFNDFEPKLFQVIPESGAADVLRVPAWLWNGEEWSAFTDAAPGVQRPILMDAIRHLRAGGDIGGKFQNRVGGRVNRRRNQLKMKINAGAHLARGRREGVADFLLGTAQDLGELAEDDECSDVLRRELTSIAETCRSKEEAARDRPKDEGGTGYWHKEFRETDLDQVLTKLDSVASMVGLPEEEPDVTEDTPCFFPVKELPDYVEALASESQVRDMAQFVDSLNLRIRGLFASGPLSSVLDPGESPEDLPLEHWLADHIGADLSPERIRIIDLSLVPSEVIHIVVAVFARIVFEALQRYRHVNDSVLPTVLVLDEAHTFAHRAMTLEGASPAERGCSRTFERIAREGRKFGLGLVLASQRPVEISPAVLSQCNTFLLHRIVNDRDQELVRHLVPDALGGLLRELPNLPARRAILLGWGAPMPALIEVTELPENQRPNSPDPDFWNVWTGERECSIDWKTIADEWTNL